jgi:hypothetical protein
VERESRIIRGIWAICLLLAGFNHARILVQHGLFWDYYGASTASALYWSSLTIIDPLVVALLVVRPRVGVPATVVVIATNVMHNLVATVRYVPHGAFFEYVTSSWQMVSQIGFLFFVVATWRMAARGIRKANGLSSNQAP